MSRELEYHLRRARTERDIAYRSGDPCVSDAHMQLSALHLQRALLLQEVRRAPAGNVNPFKPNEAHRVRLGVSESHPFIELQAETIQRKCP